MAGPRDITAFGVRLLADEAGFRRSLTFPVLLWESPPEAKRAPLLLATEPGSQPTRSRPGRPVFFDVRKTEQNAFAHQIAIGRTLNNDVAIEDNSVSRFHAFMVGPHLKQNHTWQLVDAESKVGTWVADKRLLPNSPTDLYDQSRLRIGDVSLIFLEPPTFIVWLRRMASVK